MRKYFSKEPASSWQTHPSLLVRIFSHLIGDTLAGILSKKNSFSAGSSFVDGSMSSVFSSEFSVDPNWLRCIAQTHRLPTVWVACCGNTWFQKLTMYQLWNYSDIGAVWMSFYWRTHPRQKFWHGGRQRRQQRVDFLVCHKSQTLILPLSASRQVLHPSSNCGRNAAPSHLPWNWCQLDPPEPPNVENTVGWYSSKFKETSETSNWTILMILKLRRYFVEKLEHAWIVVGRGETKDQPLLRINIIYIDNNACLNFLHLTLPLPEIEYG